MPITPVPVSELLQKTFPATDAMLASGLMDKGGAIIISGPQKIGKSLFATQLALCLASQRSFLGFEVGPAAYRTLILQAEVGEKRMQERFLKQTRGFPADALNRVMSASVFSSVQLDKPEAVLEIHEALEHLRQPDPDQKLPDLLIIDPLVNFHSGDENVAKDMTKVINVLNEFRAKGVAVVLVHHHSKGGAEKANVGHRLRGSTVLPGWYDSHFSLDWNNKERTSVKLDFEVRHDEAPETKVLKLNSETLQFEDQNDESSQIGLVVSAVEELKGATRDQVAKRYGKTPQWAGKWLQLAVEDGQLFNLQKGRSTYYYPSDQAVVFPGDDAATLERAGWTQVTKGGGEGNGRWMPPLAQVPERP